MRFYPVLVFALGCGVGGVATMIGAPMPTANSSCTVPRVDVKTTTAYVYKAPACVPVVERVEVPANCPVMLKNDEKVNTGQERVNESAAAEVKPKNRRYRRHRIRRYWR